MLHSAQPLAPSVRHAATQRQPSAAPRNTPAHSTLNEFTMVTAAASSPSKLPSILPLDRDLGQPMPFTHPHLSNTRDWLTPGVPRDEYASRQRRFLEAQLPALIQRQEAATRSGNSNALQRPPALTTLPPTSHTFVLMAGATKHIMSNDIPYPFHQNTNFLYLTGFLEPDAFLCFDTGSYGSHYTLFVLNRDPKRELWDGPRSGPEIAPQVFGCDVAFVSSAGTIAEAVYQRLEIAFRDAQAHNQLLQLFGQRDTFPPPLQRLFDTTILPLMEKGLVAPQLSTSHERLVQEMRLTKSDAELALMRQSGVIAADAMTVCMRQAHTLQQEHQLEALMQYECLRHGAQRLAYPPVVACAERNLTLHYVNNDQLLTFTRLPSHLPAARSPLILMDAGCELHGYSSDITRTWPHRLRLDRGWISKEQRELYDAVLDVNVRCIDWLEQRLAQLHAFNTRPSSSSSSLSPAPLAPALNMMHLMSERLMYSNLSRLGVFKNPTVDATVYNEITDPLPHSARVQLSALYPHFIGHWLGMDVHDTPIVPSTTPFPDRSVVTVEPGVYVPVGSPDINEKYYGIGIRIEDDVVLYHQPQAQAFAPMRFGASATNNMPAQSFKHLEVLTHRVPKWASDIEHVILSD